MKKVKIILAAVLCLAMLLSVTAMAAGSEAATPVFGGSAKASGSSITVTVTLEEGAENVHSGQLRVTWDTAEATLSSAVLGESAEACTIRSLDNAVYGEVELGFASLTAVEAGELLNLTFTARAGGDIDFTVTVAAYSVGEDGQTGEVHKDYAPYVLKATGATAYVPPTPPVQTPPVSTGDAGETGGTVTETTGAPQASVSGGEASVNVSDDIGDELVRQAEANESDTVVVAPQVPGSVTSTTVTVPAKTVGGIGEKTDADLRVETPAGNVTLPNEALEGLAEAGDLTVTVEKAGETVTVDVSAGGKAVESVPGGLKTVLALEDGQVAVRVNADGSETVIPKSLVEDGVTYVVLDGSAMVKIVDNDKSFTDVAETDWYADVVDFVAQHELFNGTGTNIFEPDARMSRAMLATVLWRLESSVKAAGEVNFPDVMDDTWYIDAITWAAGAGIVQGGDEGNFEPDRDVKREEMALMLYRYAGVLGLDTSVRASLDTFSDGDDVSSWAADAMSWAVAAGLFHGDEAGRLNPTASATRAEVAAILQRLVDKIVK